MTQYTIELIIRIALAVFLMVILGNGCVVMFNRMPARWFEDYKEGTDERVLPDELLKSIEAGRQRITSTPWKYLFTGFFGISGLYLALTENVEFEIGALIVLAIVLEMAIADKLYQVVPDQLSLLLIGTAIGFIGFYDHWWEGAAGFGIAAALMLVVYGLGRLIYHRETIGGADIKFYLAIGLVTGRIGIVSIFVLTTVFNALQAVYIKLVLKRPTERIPMLPAAFVATAVYMLFLWGRLELIAL